MIFGLLRVIGFLLNDLVMLLKEGLFVLVFMCFRIVVDATRKSLWYVRVEVILISGIVIDECDVCVFEE